MTATAADIDFQDEHFSWQLDNGSTKWYNCFIAYFWYHSLRKTWLLNFGLEMYLARLVNNELCQQLSQD